MRLDPRACLYFFAILEVYALEQELGSTGGYGGLCPHLQLYNHQLERNTKPQISTRAGHSVPILLEPGRYREFSSKPIGFSHWKAILSGEKCALERLRNPSFWPKFTPNLPVARAAPKGERGNLGREQDHTWGSLTLVLVLTGYGESALHFLLLLLRLRSHLVLDWLYISHWQPQCRLLG